MIEVRRITKQEIPHLYDISLRAHQRGYEEFIPEAEIPLFLRHYTDNELHRQKFTVELLDRFKDDSWKIWVALADGKVVGYSEIERMTPDTYFERSLFVDPAYQGKGIGEALFSRSLEELQGKHIYLTVIKSNMRAIHLYEKNGFRLTRDEAPHFYGAVQVTMLRDV